MTESYEIARSLLGDSFESCTADIRSYLKRRMAQRGESIVAAIYALRKVLDSLTLFDRIFRMLVLATGFHIHMESLRSGPGLSSVGYQTKEAVPPDVGWEDFPTWRRELRRRILARKGIDPKDSPAEASVLRQPPGEN